MSDWYKEPDSPAYHVPLPEQWGWQDYQRGFTEMARRLVGLSETDVVYKDLAKVSTAGHIQTYEEVGAQTGSATRPSLRQTSYRFDLRSRFFQEFHRVDPKELFMIDRPINRAYLLAVIWSR